MSSPLARSVSLHPYFKVHAGKLAAAQALLPEFIARTETEKDVLYYGFTRNGDEVFCREAYVGAEGALAHLANVGKLLEQFLTIADLARLEIHGPAAELEKLRGPLAAFAPIWFTYEGGVSR